MGGGSSGSESERKCTDIFESPVFRCASNSCIDHRDRPKLEIGHFSCLQNYVKCKSCNA